MFRSVTRARSIFPLTSLLTVLGAMLFALPAVAQRQDPVQVTATATPAIAHPGEYVTVTANATVEAGYHTYSIVPPAKPGPFPTEVKIALGNAKPAGAVTESTPETKFDKNFKVEVGAHSGKVSFSQVFQVPMDATGTLQPTISIRYQACDATSCLPPRTKKPPVNAIKIEAGAVRTEYANPPQPTVVPAMTNSKAASLVTPSGPKTDGGLWGFLVTAFGAGLLALITPCVFPMIPVTIAYFTKQASNNNVSIVKLAAIYSFGIVAAFTGIGAILAATIGAAGANRVAASPWTNLIFAAMFIVFGLALLEIFELQLPASLQNLSGKGRQTGGTLGVLLMGMTFVIAAFTCTAPFIGSILVAASTASSGADWIKPIVGMATFATALALPFFLLALFPGWLVKLPKSGAWLSTVKGTMGFLELAAAIKFLSNADLVWQWQVITQPVMLALWILISVMAGLWLLGILNLGFSTPTGKPTIARGLTAALFFAAAFYFTIGLSGRPLVGWLNAFLPPPDYRFNTGTSAALAADDMPYLDTLEKGIAQAKAENKPIFVDFTGYTCTNCRDMELNVFPKPEVKSELAKFVRVRLYTDGGPYGDKNQNYQDKTFQTVALPLYAVLTPEGKPIDSIAYTPDASKFAQFLQQSRVRQTAEAQ